jgi:hypothetical protein
VKSPFGGCAGAKPVITIPRFGEKGNNMPAILLLIAGLALYLGLPIVWPFLEFALNGLAELGRILSNLP